MYIVDTHCDSLLTVNSETGLINSHNLSVKYPQLQLQIFLFRIPVAKNL